MSLVYRTKFQDSSWLTDKLTHLIEKLTWAELHQTFHSGMLLGQILCKKQSKIITHEINNELKASYM